jgi:hypothetical protein
MRVPITDLCTTVAAAEGGVCLLGAPLAVGDAWGNASDRIEATLSRYQALYDLPIVENTFVLPSEHLERERDAVFFVLMTIHRDDQAVYLRSDPGDLHPRLPGRALNDNETPEDVVATLVSMSA